MGGENNHIRKGEPLANALIDERCHGSNDVLLIRAKLHHWFVPMIFIDIAFGPDFPDIAERLADFRSVAAVTIQHETTIYILVNPYAGIWL